MFVAVNLFCDFYSSVMSSLHLMKFTQFNFDLQEKSLHSPVKAIVKI